MWAASALDTENDFARQHSARQARGAIGAINTHLSGTLGNNIKSSGMAVAIRRGLLKFR